MSELALEMKELAPSQSPGSRSWRRFRRNKLAVASGIFLMLLLAVMLSTLPITRQRYDAQKLALNRHPPTWSHPLGFDSLGRDMLQRCLFGGAISFSIGLAAALMRGETPDWLEILPESSSEPLRIYRVLTLAETAEFRPAGLP